MVKKKPKPDLDSIIEEHEAYEKRLSRGAATDSGSTREEVGKVTAFFDRISVAAIALTGSLKVNDIIEIGTEDDAVRQKVYSMQIDRKDVESAGLGDEVGIKTKYKVDIGSPVYLMHYR